MFGEDISTAGISHNVTAEIAKASTLLESFPLTYCLSNELGTGRNEKSKF